MKKVSVIIPAYKPAHLAEALASVRAQTLRDYELIVVNDGSPHDLRAVVEPFRADPAGEIIYLEQANLGVAGARNRGLAQARGRYVALLDDDDSWPPDKLEWQAAFLDAHPEAAAVVGDLAVVNDAGEVSPRPMLREGSLTVEELYRNGHIWTPGQALVRAEAMPRFDEAIRTAEDFDAWCRLLRHHAMAAVPRLAIYYRMHAGSKSRNLRFMCQPYQQVMDRHAGLLPAAGRGAARLAAARRTYYWCGRGTVREWKRRVRAGDWAGTGEFLAAMGWFLRWGYSSPQFLLRLCWDLATLPAG